MGTIYPKETGDCGFVELDSKTIERIIGYYNSFMDNSMAPKDCGDMAPEDCAKKEFFRMVVSRPDFLPEDIQHQIDENRNGMPQADYLFMHGTFNSAFSAYSPSLTLPVSGPVPGVHQHGSLYV